MNWASTGHLSSKIESRQVLKGTVSNEPDNSGYDYILTDFSALVSMKNNGKNSFGFGYLLRLEENKAIHRLIQQIKFKVLMVMQIGIQYMFNLGRQWI
ncbi:hypothetical protein [Seonamhaeicola sp.]|uniref:hypothetical protein n=1 Tax=Seonamhaeicola sp. TaxID=1912245 RepID=UPI0026398BB4|nr:hypothetical protein [Seonamhaeicola sp.]